MNLNQFKVEKSSTSKSIKQSTRSGIKKEKFFIAVMGTKTLQIYNNTFISYEKGVEVLDMLHKEGIDAHLFPFSNIEEYIKKYEDLINTLENEISKTAR